MKKYRLTEESMVYRGFTLWRIQNTITGEMGGWVENYDNLSQEGECMIWGEAKVYSNAKVYGDAVIQERAELFDSAVAYDQAIVSGQAIVFNQAKVYGSAQLNAFAEIGGSGEVYGKARVEGDAEIKEHARVYGCAIISGLASITGQAKVYGYAQVSGYAVVTDDAKVHGCVTVDKRKVIEGNEDVFDGVYTWDDIASLSSLKIHLGGGVSENRTNLYANGRHQIQVEVILVAKDDTGVYFKVPDEEIYENVQFVNYRNIPFGDAFQYDDKPGEYCKPILEYAMDQFQDPIASIGTFFLSTEQLLGELILCVSCTISRLVNGTIQFDEYSTAVENGGTNAQVSYIYVQVLPPIQFRNSDIENEVIEEKDKHHSFKKYYIRFSSNLNHKLQHVACKTDNMFYVYSKTALRKSIRVFATTTDDGIKINNNVFTKVFSSPGGGDSWRVTSRNHEKTGLCLWTYFRNGVEWDGPEFIKEFPMPASFFDEYGNEAKLDFRIGNDYELFVYVV